eukprot:13093749-Ditylum_brightwellii.AAC.1
MVTILLTIHPPSRFSNHSMQGQNWAAATASLALAKCPFASQLIIAFVVVMVVWVFIVDLTVEVVTKVLVAVAMASLALAKHPFAAARNFMLR